MPQQASSSVASVTRFALGVLNRAEMPSILACRVVSCDISTGAAAEYGQMYSFVNSTVNHDSSFPSSPLILTEQGHIFCLVDERFDHTSEIHALVQRCVHDCTEQTPHSDVGNTLFRCIAREFRVWSNNHPQSVDCNAAILHIRKDGITSLTLGKAHIRVGAHRVRVRNLLSLGAVKDWLQSRLKSRLEERLTGEAAYRKEDWSWSNPHTDESVICRFEEHSLQDTMRVLALASSVWMPTEIDAITRAGFEQRGSTRKAVHAMRKTFVALGAEPHGSLFAADIAPQEADMPDADDAADMASKALKSLKTASNAALSNALSKIAGVSVIAILAGLAVAVVWKTFFTDENTPLPFLTSNGNTDRRAQGGTAAQKPINARHDSTEQTIHNEITADTTFTHQDTAAIKNTVIAIVNSPRTLVPVMLTTPAPLTESDLASRVRVEFSGVQRVRRYRLELDTAKRLTPPNIKAAKGHTNRINVIVEEPLQKGTYTVQLSYEAQERSMSAAEQSTSATLKLKVLEQFAPENKMDSAAVQLLGFSTHKLYFGSQMLMGNRQLAAVRKRTEVLLGGSVEGLLPQMSCAYRFITRSGDTLPTRYFPFDERLKNGIQRGAFISATIATVEVWVNYRHADGSNTMFVKTTQKTLQASPMANVEKMTVQWEYKPRNNTVASRTPARNQYLPNDIELSISGITFSVEETPVDSDENGTGRVYASLRDMRIRPKPVVEEPKQDRERPFGVQLVRNPSGQFNQVLIDAVFLYNANEEQIVPDKREEYVEFVPLSATFEQGKYSCKVLIKNLPPKPRKEAWQFSGKLYIEPQASILNPLNGIISTSYSSGFSVPFAIEYK